MAVPMLTEGGAKVLDGSVTTLQGYIEAILKTVPEKLSSVDTSDEAIAAAKASLDEIMLIGIDLDQAFSSAKSSEADLASVHDSNRIAPRDAINEMREQLKKWTPFTNEHEATRQDLLRLMLSDITSLDTPLPKLAGRYQTSDEWRIEEIDQRLRAYRELLTIRREKDKRAADCAAFVQAYLSSLQKEGE